MPLPLARTSTVPHASTRSAEVTELIVNLEPLDDLLCVREELLYSRDPAIGPLGTGSLRGRLYIGVKDRAKLHLIDLLRVSTVKHTARQLHVLKRHRLTSFPGEALGGNPGAADRVSASVGTRARCRRFPQ